MWHPQKFRKPTDKFLAKPVILNLQTDDNRQVFAPLLAAGSSTRMGREKA